MQSYVVSAAMRMSVSQLTPLLTSLAENAPDAHVILLVNEADSAKRERVQELNPNARLRCVSAPLIKMLLWLPPEKIRRTVVAHILSSLYQAGWIGQDVAFAAMEPHISRYYYIREVLEELKKRPSEDIRVLLTDSRDAIVQADPFEMIEEGKVYCGLEDVKIGERSQNHEWLAHLYGEPLARQLDGAYAACSGVILGDIDRMYALVDAIVSEADQHYERCAFRPALDQGIFNKLVHHDERPIQRLRNGNKILATTGTFNSQEDSSKVDYKLDPEEGVVNSKEDLIGIVHQYDRKGYLNEWIEKRYA